MSRSVSLLRRHVSTPAVLMLAVALLFAQLGALQHLVSHLHTDRVDSKALHTQLCLGCEAGSSLLSPAGSATPALLFLPATVDALAIFRAASQIPARVAHSFRSRAPPVR